MELGGEILKNLRDYKKGADLKSFTELFYIKEDKMGHSENYTYQLKLKNAVDGSLFMSILNALQFTINKTRADKCHPLLKKIAELWWRQQALQEKSFEAIDFVDCIVLLYLISRTLQLGRVSPLVYMSFVLNSLEGTSSSQN